MTSNRRGQFDTDTISDVTTLNHFVRVIENREARRLGVSVKLARPRIANRIGVAPGTMENLRRLRRKIVPSWLMKKIRTEFIRILQSEIQRLEHEITIARQIDPDHRGDLLAAAEAHLEATRQIVDKAMK